VRTEARIIDASANRAREGLRVIEDIARFGYDDERLTAELKSIRHDLAAALDRLAALGLDRARRLAARDTPGDVGTAITTPAEGTRHDLAAVAAAAAARTSEALRSIEECTKALGATDAWPAFEALRYRLYHAERRLADPRPAPQWRLCVIISEALCRHHDWKTVAERAIEGGAAGTVSLMPVAPKKVPEFALASVTSTATVTGPSGRALASNP